MLSSVPTYVSVIFILTTLLTLFLCYRIFEKSEIDAKHSNRIMIGLVIWLVIHLVLSINYVYRDTMDQVPPPFVLVVFLTFLVIIGLFITKGGKSFMDRLTLLDLTILSVVRIPVELVLYWLFVYQAVPELMTFSGRNFDILAGITAPFVAYFGIKKRMMGRSGLLMWNFIGLCLLLFIIVNALLSAPTFLQKFAFDQPNIGLVHFPFVWLAAFVAPAVLISHLVSIRKLILSSS